MSAVPILHLCRFSKWSDAIPTFESNMRQARACTICNRIQMRTVRDMQLTGAAKVNAALAAFGGPR